MAEAPPLSPTEWNDRGVALERAGKLADAEAAYRHALALPPAQLPIVLNNLGNVLRKQGRIHDAAGAHRESARLDPGYAPAFNNLAATLYEAADVRSAIECDRRVIELLPNRPEAHSALLYNLHYDPNIDQAGLFAEHLRWAEKHEDPVYDLPWRPHDNSPEPNRRLRLGYVSADFRQHPAAVFQEASIRGHDREQIEVVCYSDATRLDAVTHRLKGHADQWRDTAKLSDEQLAEMVRQDGIDVLVDLPGHASGNRLMTFARRPAPVQVNYNGYVDTTGMRSMGWRITDALHDPPGKTDRYHTERLYRLPMCNWCYVPADETPSISELPATRNGFITFGCLNKVAKMSAPAARLWASVLAAVPNSRLLVSITGNEQTNPGVRQHFEACGIPGDRLTLVARTGDSAGYFARFNDIDIALDPFPFNGITSTCDALWMGVPMVTLAGRNHAGRAGVSLLTAAGLEGLIARTPEQYVGKAAGLALAVDRLQRTRTELRDRLAASPLRDERMHARNLDAAFRHMWRQWCSVGASKGCP